MSEFRDRKILKLILSIVSTGFGIALFLFLLPELVFVSNVMVPAIMAGAIPRVEYLTLLVAALFLSAFMIVFGVYIFRKWRRYSDNYNNTSMDNDNSGHNTE